MGSVNPHNVLWLIKQEIEETPLSVINDAEKEIASYLKDILLEASKKNNTYVEVLHDLVECHVSEVKPIYDPEADDDDFRTDPSVLCNESGVSFEYKKAVVTYWNEGDGRKSNSKTGTQGSKPRRAFSSVQHKFKLLRHREQLYRWERQVQAGGTHKEKLRHISESTFQKFMQSKRDHLITHDLDLRRWALSAARRVNCQYFKASESWVLNFKKAHNIVSRKITKFVSRRDVEDREGIENAAVAFQLEVQPIIEDVGPHNSINSDQSGFVYELHSGRTLEIQGERKVERIVQSKNATTHSFTVMPAMRADGRLFDKLYVVLQEPSGKFGPQVKNGLLQAPNLVISCSKSGKMGKDHLNEWVQDVLMPECGDRSLLVVDSWSTFTEENLRQKIPAQQQVLIHQIPPGATGLVQPWDVWGFRLWKNFVRQFEDFVLLHKIDLVLSQRNNTLKLVSLVYCQLSSPRYYDVFKYSWFKAGLVHTRPDAFLNPVKFAFRGSQLLCDSCDAIKLLTCSWCQKSLCILHFFYEYHLCEIYVP